MKIFITLVIFFGTILLNAQVPKVKFYLNDANIKTYSIDDIVQFRVINGKDTYMMQIYSNSSLSASYVTQKIDSIKFESIDSEISNIVIYSANLLPQTHKLINVDSIIFISVISPKITSIEPDSAKTGDIVSINGNNFGTIQGSSIVSFNGEDAQYYSNWYNTLIKVKVPADAATGNLNVTVNDVQSNNVYFRVIPRITSILPISGKVGDLITITGSGFGPSQDSGIVSFNSIEASGVTSWNSTNIIVAVPPEAATGKLSVTVGSIKSNVVDFTLIVPPTITSINPTSFGVGDEVTINGKNFGSTQISGVVMFGSVSAFEITSWSDTKIKCLVPDDAISGKLTVIVDGNQSNEVSYKITSSLALVLIPSGSFQMGNTGSYADMIYIPEDPVHKVTIGRNFYMSKYEINQKLYTAVMNTNQSNHRGPEFPVERISWYDAVAFCNGLSVRDGYTKCYTINGTSVTCDWSANGYRLPTEAEWEYACKAGTKTDFYSGNKESDLARVAWYSGNSGDSTHIPGQKDPNQYGLYDMHGNVFEWVWDWSGTYDSGSVTDPTGPMSGTVKILRGGSWHNGMANGMCRSSFRGWEDTPNSHSSTDGIRVIRVE